MIAAATIGERINVIDENMSGALILVAVISSVISPIGFKKIFPQQEVTEARQKVVFIGANQMTLPVTRELNKNIFETTVFHTRQDKIDKKIVESVFKIEELSDYSLATLKELNIFKADILVVATGDEDRNAEIAIYAKETNRVKRVIASVASPSLADSLKEHDIDVFSVLLSTKTLLRALIEAPSVMRILQNEETTLYQINMNNYNYDGIYLRNFPFTGDIIFVRIFRGNDSIVPHGDTELKAGDRLIVTGSREYVDELKVELEFVN
ncbi:potassium channel family protein [Bacillus carboniphilus]|uniref:potassium channel family protein n=1 Tax=Bacillus carboniphilus TaxID=86663 RepID=UPI0035324247